MVPDTFILPRRQQQFLIRQAMAQGDDRHVPFLLAHRQRHLCQEPLRNSGGSFPRYKPSFPNKDSRPLFTTPFHHAPANISAMVPDSLFTLNGHDKVQFSDTSGSG